MIIRIFRQGQNNGSAAINYLFDDETHQAIAPKLIQGSANLTKELISSITRKHKYISGVISFRQNEDLTHVEKLDLINHFQKTFAPFDSQERVNFLWVEHRDKGRLELHFLCPRIDLKTKKAFNLHPPGNANKRLYSTFTQLQNQKYGFQQVDKRVLDFKEVKNIFDEFKLLQNERKQFLISVFDKPIKKRQYNNRNKGAYYDRQRNEGQTFYKDGNGGNSKSSNFKPFSTSRKLSPTIDAFGQVRQNLNVSNNNGNPKNESINQNLGNENTGSLGESIRGFIASREESTKSQNIQNKIISAISIDEQLYFLGLSLQTCELSEVYSITAQINFLKGQKERLPPPTPQFAKKSPK